MACPLTHNQFIIYFQKNTENWDFLVRKDTSDKIIRIAFDRYLSHFSVTLTKYYD